jgi:purine-binding chemotaxis protein CheW
VTASSQLEHKLRSLREAFDRSFAEGVAPERPEQVDFLSIRVAGDPYALRLSEIQSLHVARKLVAAPSLVPALLGLAGFRGVLTPIYDLSPLLGYAAQPTAKWLVVARSESPIGFAFEGFDAHLRVDAERVSNLELASRDALCGVVQSGGLALPLLHLPSLIAGIAQRIKAFEPSQER